MENSIIVPFDLNTARKIKSGEIEGSVLIDNIEIEFVYESKDCAGPYNLLFVKKDGYGISAIYANTEGCTIGGTTLELKVEAGAYFKKGDVLTSTNGYQFIYDGIITKGVMGCIFNLMFGQKDYTFPIQDLVEYKKKSNAFWIKRIDNLLKYYERNRITLTESSFEYTVLMDEPDRNLDIDNIMQIYNVLSFHKPQTQIIAIVHNPALIYKLSKLDCVNFIEMAEGYLSKTCIFVSN